MAWTIKKIEFDSKNKEHLFREREVWWAALGKNIGQEMNGKNSRFERLVLIIKKYSRNKLFGLPITTQLHTHYSNEIIVQLNNRKMAVSLSQGRTLSSKRLVGRLGVLPVEIYYEIVKNFKDQF